MTVTEYRDGNRLVAEIWTREDLATSFLFIWTKRPQIELKSDDVNYLIGIVKGYAIAKGLKLHSTTREGSDWSMNQFILGMDEIPDAKE